MLVIHCLLRINMKKSTSRAWSPSLLQRRSLRNSRQSKSPTPSVTDFELEEETLEELEVDNFSSTDDSSQHSTDKLKAMRKSLRSRSVCNGAPSSASNNNNYSLYAGLKGVNSLVTVTGSHISGRRLSTPASFQEKANAVLTFSHANKTSHRSKRSESATTVEEEASKLRAYMASRHGSLPMVILNDRFYAPSSSPIKSMC